MKSKKIIIPLVALLGLSLALAYTKMNPLFSAPKSTTAQTTNLNQEILGTWHLEGSPADTYEYLNNGVKNTYSNGTLVSSSFYEICTTCSGTPSDDPTDRFLKEMDADGFEKCYFINGINVDNSAIMSLMDDRGTIIRLER